MMGIMTLPLALSVVGPHGLRSHAIAVPAVALAASGLLFFAGLFVMVGALVCAGVAWSGSQKEAIETGVSVSDSEGACSPGSAGSTSCQDIHTLLRKKPVEESPARLPASACCPASPARPAAPAAVEGIQ